ncbi:MAG TPA: MauE/DoxX family redox-associated membrane protein [Acidimicrobiales bacterium]|nr:MauE/DoxX family redox-associated membrane protein [Acidimicrobiales bacterium]
MIGWAGPLGYTCAAVLAVLFAWASVGKLSARRATVARLSDGRVHLPGLVTAVVPVVELLLAVLLVARPADGGAAALVALALFHLVLAWDLGARAGCAWFGSARPQPVSGLSVARTFGLGVLAVGALGAGPGARMPQLADIVLVTTTVVVGIVLLTVGDVRRRVAAAEGVR